MEAPRTAWSSIVLVLLCSVFVPAGNAHSPLPQSADPHLALLIEVACGLDHTTPDTLDQTSGHAAEYLKSLSQPAFLGSLTLGASTTLRPSAHLLEQAALFIRAP